MAPIDVNDGTKNWLKVGLALKHLKNGLLPFVSQHISALHASIISHRSTCTSCTTENVLPCPTPGMCRFKHKRCQYHDQADPQKQTRLCPSGVCENVSVDIETNHVFGRPNWKNTDATKWASDPWEMAKCFLPTGYTDVQSALETDCTAILSLCLNCGPLETAMRPVKGLVEQNRTNRNEVMHSGSQELTATERGTYIQDAINLLTGFQTPIAPDTQTCIDILTELNTDGFIVTTDDFSDVIRDAVDAIRQQQETIQDELESGRTAAEENKTSIANLQAEKVDQEKYIKKITEMDKQLKSIYPRVQRLHGRTQTETRKRMEAVRKGIEGMKTDIGKRVEAIEGDMKQLQGDMEQLKRLQKSEVTKRKHQVKELDEVKSKVAKLVTSHEMDIDVVKSDMLTLEGRVGDIQEHSKLHGVKEQDLINVQNQGRERLRDHLVNVYKKTCSKMPVAPPKRNMLADIKDHYRSQDMKQVKMSHESKSDHKGQVNVTGKRRDEVDREVDKLTVVKSYHDIFHRKGKRCQHMYIKGEAGSGKSVFCQNMVNKWCEIKCSSRHDNDVTDDTAGPNNHDMGQNEVQPCSSLESDIHNEPSSSGGDDNPCIDEVNAPLVQTFEFLFYIELRYATEHRDIHSMIKEILLMNNDDLATTLTEVLKVHPEKCLVILDGLDEWTPPKGSPPAPHVTRGLPGRNITTNWTVLTTTRPWKLELIRPESEEMDQLIELSGLTRCSAEACTTSVVRYLNDRFQENKSASICQRDLTTDRLQHFMTFPVLLKQLICIWYDEGQVGNSYCDIYAGMVDVYLRYSSQRHESLESITNSSYSLPSCLLKRDACKKCAYQLTSLGKLAFHTLFTENRESSLVFNSNATEMYGMSETETDMWLNVGLLTKDIAHRGCSTDHTQLSFLHKSIQEFLAAVYISICDDEVTTKRISDACTSVEMVMEMSQVFVFVAGMNPSAFTKISKHIADVSDHDETVQAERDTLKRFPPSWFYYTMTQNWLPVEFTESPSQIEVIQDLLMKCINESKSNHHSDIAIHIRDVILGKRFFRNLDDVIAPQLDLIKMNRADLVSLSLDVNKEIVEPKHSVPEVKTGQDIFTHYLFKELGDAPVHRFEHLRTIHFYDTDIRSVAYILEKCQNTLERVSLEYQCLVTALGGAFMKYGDSRYDLREADIHLRSFPRFTHLHAISLSCLELSYHQVNQILSLTQNPELREIVLSDVVCSPCIGKCVNCCENQFDLSQINQLQRLDLDKLTLVEYSRVIQHVARVDNKQVFNQSSIRINTTQLESCIITNTIIVSLDGRTQFCPVEFVGTHSQPYIRFNLDKMSLQHDELLKIVSFVSETTYLRSIDLSGLTCVDCKHTCDIALDFSKHTLLETLIVSNARRFSMPGTIVFFNELHVDTTNLQKCTIQHDENAIMQLQLEGTIEKLRSIELSDIALYHDQFQGVMSLLAHATDLEEMNLCHIRCVDHGDKCKCQLDMTTHTTLKTLVLGRLQEHVRQGTINAKPNPRSYFEGYWAWLGYVPMTVLNTDTSHLRINGLTVTCTRLETCLIKGDNVLGQQQRGTALTTIVFIGTGECLCTLNLSNIALPHDQVQGLMSFVSRTTRLKDIVLSELSCLDCGNMCNCQLYLTEHTSLEKLYLNELHIMDLKVNTTRMWTCAITKVNLNVSEACQHDSDPSVGQFIGTGECLIHLDISSIGLKHDQLQGVMSFVSRASRLRKITLSELRCVDHDDTCDCQLELVKHTSLKKLNLDKLHLNILKVSCINQFLTNSVHDMNMVYHFKNSFCSVNIEQLHVNVVQISSDSLKLDKSYINELIVDTTHLVKCIITDIRSNDSESRQLDSALSAFRFIGTGERLRYLHLSDIAVKHDQLQGVMSFVTQATHLIGLTMSDLRCVDHGDGCECQVELAEHKLIETLKLNRVHVTWLNEKRIESFN